MWKETSFLNYSMLSKCHLCIGQRFGWNKAYVTNNIVQFTLRSWQWCEQYGELMIINSYDVYNLFSMLSVSKIYQNRPRTINVFLYIDIYIIGLVERKLISLQACDINLHSLSAWLLMFSFIYIYVFYQVISILILNF